MNSSSKKIALASIFAVTNVLLAFLALSLKLPIYLDCIGTISSTKILGMKYGILTAIVSALINFTYDSYAIYYMPVAIAIAILANLFNAKKFKNGNIFIKTAIISILPSILAAIITAKIFGGITSSGSSIVLQALTKLGLPMTVAAFLVQLPTDFLDKFIAIILSDKIYTRLNIKK
ncbi:MAG: ECF transporter S component [Tissierellia bacterium]|nr:ECF transporter S component [Tissierellia bacterium]